MQTNKGQRLKLPHTAADISELEDELANLSHDLRAIRSKMADKQVASVDLMSGTFSFYLAEMRQIAKDWGSEIEKQLIARNIEATRERKRKEIESKQKKR